MQKAMVSNDMEMKFNESAKKQTEKGTSTHVTNENKLSIHLNLDGKSEWIFYFKNEVCI